MSRSQRHKIIIQGTDSAGKGLAEKQPAIVYIQQFAASLPFTVPMGAPNGPLQGSSIAGYPPVNIPLPGMAGEDVSGAMAPLGAMAVSDDFTAPGQFNNSGNPIFTDLPSSNEPVTPPEQSPPSMTSVNPNSAAASDPDLQINAIGSNFDPMASITLDGTPQPTSFINANELQMPLSPQTLGPGVYMVGVRNSDGQDSADQYPFTIAATAGARAFPIGPVTINHIAGDPAGIAVVLSAASDVQVGDTVLIEATGNTSVNGSWTVVSSDGTNLVVDNAYTLATPIDAKGRLTVTG